MVTAARLVRNWREPVTRASSFYAQQKRKRKKKPVAVCRVWLCVSAEPRLQGSPDSSLPLSGKSSSLLIFPDPIYTIIFVFADVITFSSYGGARHYIFVCGIPTLCDDEKQGIVYCCLNMGRISWVFIAIEPSIKILAFEKNGIEKDSHYRDTVAVDPRLFMLYVQQSECVLNESALKAARNIGLTANKSLPIWIYFTFIISMGLRGRRWCNTLLSAPV